MRTWIDVAPRVTVLALLLTASGCAGLGGLENVLGGMGGVGGTDGRTGQIRGEVRYVDERGQRVELETQNGRTETVGYDSRTEVLYQQQRYPVNALERGDLVTVEVQQDSRRALYASRILVEQSVQDRRGGSEVGGGAVGRVQRFDGRVSWVDVNRGQFGLQAQQGGTLVVSLPYGPSDATVDRFRRLRQGDSVRIEGELLNQGRVELHRFL